jgi:hypothetical protein
MRDRVLVTEIDIVEEAERVKSWLTVSELEAEVVTNFVSVPVALEVVDAEVDDVCAIELVSVSDKLSVRDVVKDLTSVHVFVLD